MKFLCEVNKRIKRKDVKEEDKLTKFAYSVVLNALFVNKGVNGMGYNGQPGTCSTAQLMLIVVSIQATDSGMRLEVLFLIIKEYAGEIENPMA